MNYLEKNEKLLIDNEEIKSTVLPFDLSFPEFFVSIRENSAFTVRQY